MACSFTFVISHFTSISPASQNSMRSGLLSTSVIQKPSLICYKSKKKLDFVDQIIDFMEGGPKLRKWYGAPDLVSKQNEIPDDDEETEIRDAVLVTNGDSEIGQMVILSLIVKQIKVKAFVKNKQAAIEAFGTYVESVVGNASNRALPLKVLRGVRAIISPNEGFLSSNRNLGGVQHIILLSQLSVYRGFTGFQALMKKNSRDMAEQDEAIAMASGVPYTIIRAGLLEVNRSSRKPGFSFEEGSAVKGSLSMEDAANICTEALEIVPQTGIIFEVVNGEEKIISWKQHLVSLIQKAGQQPM